MIVDKINNYQRYFDKEIFKEIFLKLKQINIDTPNGEYFRTDDYYFKVMSYKTQKISNIIESHLKEVDIQILLSGKEEIHIYNSENVNVIKDYNNESDCQFYVENGDYFNSIKLLPGYMAVFFKDDIHHPQIAVNENEEIIKKIVIKINEKLFTH